jgi:hypothetical protein
VVVLLPREGEDREQPLEDKEGAVRVKQLAMATPQTDARRAC